MRDILLLTLVLCGLFLSGLGEEEDNGDNVDQIIGGSAAPKGKYPYMVFFYDAKNYRAICTGTLIRPTKVLTAATCFPNGVSSTDSIAAIMNTVTLNDEDRIVRWVTNVQNHGFYHQEDGDNNLAIVTLNTPVSSTSVKPVPMGYNTVGSYPVAVGWNSAGNLRQSSLTYQNGPVCSAAFDFIYYSNYLKFMCYATSRSGACSHDKGGPILINGKQIGIIVQSRCGGGEPMVAFDIRSYEGWIQSWADATPV